jgi:NAD-dependent deacetylase
VTPPFPAAPEIVVLTGPGLAREAGFAPFDPAALPARLRLEDILTRDGFERDRAAVQGFYNARRRQLQTEIRPNAAHEALAILEMTRRNEVLIVTRNTDDLHERAGSRAVLHTHGELLKARCLICTHVSEWRADIDDASACPVCGNAGHLRPGVVWVGEDPLHMETVYEAVAHCRQFWVVGAAVAAEPWAGLLSDAIDAGARTVEFAAAASAASERFDEVVTGPLVETVPEFVKRQV